MRLPQGARRGQAEKSRDSTTKIICNHCISFYDLGLMIRLLSNDVGVFAGCHCWLVQQCWAAFWFGHCWTSQQWHPIAARSAQPHPTSRLKARPGSRARKQVASLPLPESSKGDSPINRFLTGVTSPPGNAQQAHQSSAQEGQGPRFGNRGQGDVVVRRVDSHVKALAPTRLKFATSVA